MRMQSQDKAMALHAGGMASRPSFWALGKQKEPYVWGLQKIRESFTKDHSILGSMLGSPILGNCYMDASKCRNRRYPPQTITTILNTEPLIP